MDKNLRDRLFWLPQRIDGMKMHRTGLVEYSDSDCPAAFFNSIWGIPENSEETREITWHYIERNMAATWWLPSDDTSQASWWLAEHGWGIEDILTGMVLDPKVADLQLKAPAELKVVRCQNPKEVRDAGYVMASPHLLERPRETDMVAQAFNEAAELILGPDSALTLWVGYADGCPATVIAMFSEGSAVSLYGLTTHPGFRGRKYAKSVAFKALETALGRGAGQVTLQVTSDGVKAFKNTGFAPVSQFVLWSNRAAL